MANLIFNDYLIFADEAGDHNLKPHNKDFPLFVLAFCIIKRDHYADFIVPELMRLKLKYFQDSHVVFHERDIRKAIGAFEFLTESKIRAAFCNDLNEFFRKAKFKVIASIIQKDQLPYNQEDVDNPYILATGLCVETLLGFLNFEKQVLKTTITFESRGKKEDQDLELAFLRIMQDTRYHERFNIKIAPKVSNCAGLQLADLVARPIGRYILNPKQENRAFEIINEKTYLKVFP
ncbi:MAG TPA: DUF3800 domain-containing protein [Rickettsia endosymbiont of Pyrocoelia pectoralis]|nr:DUF3800 domain-containing protein [Rickettsia endosymbiont of Pyrocoelia pectoralis]